MFTCTAGVLWSFRRAGRRAAEDLNFLLKALELSMCLAIGQAQEEQSCFAEDVLSISVIVVIIGRLCR